MKTRSRFFSPDQKHKQKMTYIKVKFSFTKKQHFKCSIFVLIIQVILDMCNVKKIVVILLHWEQESWLDKTHCLCCRMLSKDELKGLLVQCASHLQSETQLKSHKEEIDTFLYKMDHLDGKWNTVFESVKALVPQTSRSQGSFSV